MLNETFSAIFKQCEFGDIYLFSISGSSNKRHAKEIRATYLSLVIVVTFTVLNLPRIVASTLEVTNTNLIIFCVENEVRYVPSIDFYKLDFFARLFMVVNSALNFIIYCAVSTPFQVKHFRKTIFATEIQVPFVYFCIFFIFRRRFWNVCVLATHG